MAKILCGKTLAKEIREQVKIMAEKKEEKNKNKPSLAIIQGGDRPDSNQYVSNKLKACKANNIDADLIKIPENDENYLTELRAAVVMANLEYDSVIVQVPIPGLTKEEQDQLINLIYSEKDVDGMKKITESKFYTDNTSHKQTAPCTPMGIMTILDYYNIPLSGENVVIIGRSDIVGRPLAHLMMIANATVTVCHSKTPWGKLHNHIKDADIVVCAVGKPEFINEKEFPYIDWSNKTLIDVGTNRVGDAWFGDISQSIKEKSYAYTPVPGGVGPMTITSLLQKVVDRAK